MSSPTPPFGSAEQRESYRVKYPLGYPARLQPQVLLHPERKVILEDWSEFGVRLNIAEPRPEKIGDDVTMTITTSAGDSIDAHGAVIWTDAKSIAIRFTDDSVPWKMLLDEQRAIAHWRDTRIELI